MHYLLIKPEHLKVILTFTDLDTVEQVSRVLDNFANLCGCLEKSEDISDMRTEALEKIKSVTGVTHPLKFKKLLLDIKKGTSDLQPEVLNQINSILSDSKNYTSATYLNLDAEEYAYLNIEIGRAHV